MEKKKKEPPKPLLCKCGGRGVVIRQRKGLYYVYCLDSKCGAKIRGHTAEAQAITDWNKGVTI